MTERDPWNGKLVRACMVPAFVLLASACLPALAAGDPKLGVKVFSTECSECHSVKEGRNKKGPSLFAIVGRKAASLPDVKYSDALRQTGWIWDEATLRNYLSKPAKQANPGSKMKYDGLQDPQALEDLIEYLGTNK